MDLVLTRMDMIYNISCGFNYMGLASTVVSFTFVHCISTVPSVALVNPVGYVISRFMDSSFNNDEFNSWVSFKDYVWRVASLPFMGLIFTFTSEVCFKFHDFNISGFILVS